MVNEIINIASKYGINIEVKEALEIEKEIKRWLKPSVDLSEKVVRTKDGSFTCINEKYGEPYHSITAGAVRECYEKFILPSGILEKAKYLREINILDIGFGLGYNSAIAIYHLKRVNPDIRINIRAFDIEVPSFIPDLPDEYRNVHKEIINSLPEYRKGYVEVKLILGDVREKLPDVDEFFDVVFHDAFSPFRNPEMWTLDFLKVVYDKMQKEAVWVSYTSALCVRKALIDLGLSVKESFPVGRRRGGTVAFKSDSVVTSRDILDSVEKSPYAIPLRDECLCSEPFEILVRYFCQVFTLKTCKRR